jgi:hypothetical protein
LIHSAGKARTHHTQQDRLTRSDVPNDAIHMRSDDMTAAVTRRNSPDPDRLMTIDEVATYVQLSKFTLYKMRAEGHGPPGQAPSVPQE